MRYGDILANVNRFEAEILIRSCGLRKKYERVLLLKYVDDLSYQEIGGKIGMTEKSVSNLMVKARKQFDKFIGS